MNEIVKTEDIKNKIYEIRGAQVMLDSDLAKLYHVETKVLNQSVKRNIKRFPEEFMFQLDESEFLNLRSKNVTSSDNYGGRRYLPYVFTEQGVSMLAGILKSDIAIDISIKIINVFVAMRKYISNEMLDQNKMLINHENRINLLEETFSCFKAKNNEIYYSGQFYDAYSKVLDIFNEAKSELIVVDAYADKSVLDIIRRLKVNVILIVKTKSLLNQMHIDKYNKQYSNLKIIYNDEYHDRYFVIDRNKVYHCGTSLNYIGKKTFCINIIGDEKAKESLIDIITEKI